MSEEEDYIGKEIILDTKTIKNEKGLWVATMVVTQKRTTNLLEWESVESKFRSVAKEFGSAVADVNFSAQQVLKDCEYDLFSKEE